MIMSKLPAKANSESLVARIERAAHMVYMEGATEAQISEAFGIKGVTLRDWKKRPEWEAAISELKGHQRKLVFNRLSFLTEKAVTAIEELLDSPNDSVKLKAAEWVLERGPLLNNERNRATSEDRMGSVEKFTKLVMIDADQ
jgi:hypothetical protein